MGWDVRIRVVSIHTIIDHCVRMTCIRANEDRVIG